MKRKLVIVAVLVFVGTLGGDVPVRAKTAQEKLAPWTGFIAEASRKFGVPDAWIEAVIMAESGGNASWRGRPITSAKGAMGLMQLMPATYADMRLTYGLGADPYDPHDNILAGTAYLRAMFDRFGFPGLFGAYNAGPGRFQASLIGRPLPIETRRYLNNVSGNASATDAMPGLFVVLSGPTPVKATGRTPRLFVPLSNENSPAN